MTSTLHVTLPSLPSSGATRSNGRGSTVGFVQLPGSRADAVPILKPVAHSASFNHGVHGARGLLALLVFVFHIACSDVQSFPIQNLAVPHAGLISLQFGVEIFFCISGFIVVGALKRAGTPVSFMLDRAMRILPVLWLTLAIIIPLGLLTHQREFAGLGLRELAWVVPFNLVPLAGVLPVPVLHMAAWSLSYELVFYVVAATLWFLPQGRLGLRMVTAAVAAGLVIWHPRALFFAVGVLVSRTDITRHPVLKPMTRCPELMLIGFMACWYEVQFGGGRHGDASAWAWVQDGSLGLAAIAVSFSILAFSGIVSGRGLLVWLLRSAAFQWLGSVSYSFYLWHLIVIAVAKRALATSGLTAVAGPWSQVLLLAVCLPASLVVAYHSMHLVEQGFAAWLKRQRVSIASAPAVTGSVVPA